MNLHVHKINRDLVIGWMVIVAVLFVSYLGEVLKGERTIGYFFLFMLATAIPAIICLVLFLRKPDRKELRYYIVVGYFVMYVFSMMTGSTSMVFSYILPMLSLLVLYHQPRLILFTGIASLIVNLISLYHKFQTGVMNLSNSKDAEIQVALLVLCFAGSYAATRLYDEITKQNISYLKILNEKNDEIQKMALQTITTIANTIDAKDGYTQGHSKRVSEYSVEIAGELGLPEKEIQNIRSVALLHDIGKIGVPDSVLNKPGKLTNEEFRLMKQHPVMGGEILKDINMIQGVDIGAKYHHERYDGKGYPDGLMGEQIPFIARIIAVADAYDAMTSNRVYRKHLSEEEVLSELEKGIGTQFDPAAARALIRMIREGRMDNHDLEAAEEPHVKETTQILSRVMEKQKEQITENMLIDDLTGTYNRSSGEKLMRDALDEIKGGSLMLFDLDHFRKINDKTGFVRGDLFLRVTAKCIQNMGEDIIIARFGGDEFAVLFPSLSKEEEIVQALENFQREITSEVAGNKELEGLSVSVGVVIRNNDKMDFTTLFLKADKALYYVKQQGGGSYYIHQDGAAAEESNPSKVDLDHLVQFIRKNGQYEDGQSLIYPEFGRIYEFIQSKTDIERQKIQLLMFTISTNEGIKLTVEDGEEIMGFLERAISNSMPGKELSTRYSSVQQLVLMIDMKEKQVEELRGLIIKEFYKMYDRREVNVNYDMASLG